MNYRKLISLLLLFGFAQAFANDFRVHFPEYAGQSASLSYKYGIKEETVSSGILDKNGQLTLVTPPEADSYSGIATLTIGNDVRRLEFVVNNESPVLRGEAGNIIFENSSENDSLQSWFPKNAILKEKLILSSQLLSLYEENEVFYPMLKKELESQETDLKAFKDFIDLQALEDSYAAKFIQLHSFLNDEVNALVYMDSTQMAAVRNYLINDLDINALYTSGLWFNTINGLLAMYKASTPFHEEFIADMSQLLKRAKDGRTYTTLAENMFEICEAMDWQEQGELLALALLNDDRFENPQGKLKLLLGTNDIRKGKPAPPLVSKTDQPASGQPTSVILIFYENGCTSCQTELENFITNYPRLQELGIRIITVSADIDEEMYHRLADRFPWEEKYCDFKGFEGPDFQNYGIIATPSIFVIDKDGIIQGRYARFKDLRI